MLARHHIISLLNWLVLMGCYWWFRFRWDATGGFVWRQSSGVAGGSGSGTGNHVLGHLARLCMLNDSVLLVYLVQYSILMLGTPKRNWSIRMVALMHPVIIPS